MRGLIIAVALAMALPAGAQEQDTGRTAPGELVVTGTGRVAVEPDLARIRLGVVAEADEAGAAAAALSQALDPVLAGLTEAGVGAPDIRTGTLQIGPVYPEPSGAPGERAEIAGYRAESLVTVTLRDIGRVGEILDAAIGDGANRLEGISFAPSDPAAVEEAALAAAVADAMRKAQIVSEAAGQTLGSLVTLAERSGGGGPVAMRMSAADMPVAPGEVEVTAQVEATFALRE